MATKKKKKQPAYDPFAQWTQSIAQMRRNASRTADNNIASLISALPSQAALRDAQAREAQGLGRLNASFLRHLSSAAQNAAGTAAGVGGAYQQAFNQARGQANGLAIAAGGPQTSTTGGQGLLAAMGANNAQALQGNVQAGAAMGTLSQQESLARLAAALKDRQAQVTNIRGRRGAFFDDALNALYQRAMQQATMRDNSRLAWSQFGEQQNQNAINNQQQDAAQAAQNDLAWAQLNAQQQAAMSRDDAAGEKARKAFIKKLRRQFYKQRNRTEDSPAKLADYTIRVTNRNQDGTYTTKNHKVKAETEEAAYAQLQQWYPTGTGWEYQTVSEKRGTVKQRVNQDRDLAERYRKALRDAGFQEKVAIQLVNNWLRLRWGASR